MYHPNLQLGSPRARLASSRGFSVVDALVAMTLSLVIIGAALSFNRYQLFALRTQAKQIDSQGSGRALTDLMVGEIRRAGTDPKCARNFEVIGDARADRLRVRSDLDGSGAIDASGEDVTYRFYSNSKSLGRTTGGFEEMLVDGKVLVLLFQYFNAGGVELAPGESGLDSTQRASVRRVRLTVIMQDSSGDPNSSVPVSTTFSSTVDIRNRFLVSTVSCT